MAIAEILRIDITAHQSLKERIIPYLHRKGVVQIIEAGAEEDLLEYGEEELEMRIKKRFRLLQDASTAFEALKPFSENIPLLKRLKQTPPVMAREDFEGLGDEGDLHASLEQIIAISTRLPEIVAALQRLQREQKELQPWEDLTSRVSRIADLRFTRAVLGRVSREEMRVFRGDFSAIDDVAAFEVVSEYPDYSYLSVISHEAASGRMQAFLAEHGFEEISLAVGDESALNALLTIGREIADLREEEKDIKDSLAAAAARLSSRLQSLQDFYTAQQEHLAVRRHVGHTAKVFQVRGWVLKDAAADLSDDLESLGPVHIETRVPEAEDGPPPVALQNRGWLNPFQLVTELYGLPRYAGIDPTAALAPFFFLFFGLCLSDAGYGIMLAGSMVAVMYLLGIKGRLFALFLFGGIATIIGGAVTGSWFGVNVFDLDDNHWASFLKMFALFDPVGSEAAPFMGLRLVGTMAFFYLSVFLGYIQICCGTLISVAYSLRRGDFISGIFDHGAWLATYIGLFLYVLSLGDLAGMPSYAMEGVQQPGLILIGAGMAARLFICPVMQVLTGDGKKGIGGILGKVTVALVLILDNSKNLLGNVLSYCRLMALGMATGIIGGIINMLAGQVADVINSKVPFVGYIVLAIMVFGGHVLNLMINLLGSFVHTARLQYVEFFPYFFEGGGEPFRPFAEKYRFINIED